jgi:hypothetical protein
VSKFLESPREDVEGLINQFTSRVYARAQAAGDTELARIAVTGDASRMMLASVVDYVRFGQRTYVIGPRAQELLSRTTLSNIPRAAIKPPLDAFYVAFPQCCWRLWGGPRTQWHYIGGAYVRCATGAERHATCRRTSEIMGLPASQKYLASLSEDSDRLSDIAIVVWGKENAYSAGPEDTVFSHFNIRLDGVYMPGNSGIEGMVQRLGVETKPELDCAFTDLSTQPKVHYGSLSKVVRVVVNSVLYLTSDKAEVRTVSRLGNKARRASKKTRRRRDRLCTNTTYYIVGESLERREFSKEEGGLSKVAADSRKSTVRHWVQGHWHGYYHGPRDSADRELRTKWVMPFQRGGREPDSEEMLFRRRTTTLRRDSEDEE